MPEFERRGPDRPFWNGPVQTKLEAPCLDDLSVQIPAPIPPTADQLIERLHQELRARLPRRERSSEEAVQLGDDVECDVITLVDGCLVPGGLMSSAVLEMRELTHLPGLVDSIVGMKPSSARTFEIELPDDYPVQAFAGRLATLYVEVKRAFAVPIPVLDDIEALKEARLGVDITEAMESVAGIIDEEQGQELLLRAKDAVLEAMAERVSVEIPDKTIDEQLKLRWDSGPGSMLAEKKDIPLALKQEAWRLFVSSPELRREESLRQKIGLALAALIEAEGITPEEDTMVAILEPAAEVAGVSLADFKLELKNRPKEAEILVQHALQLAAEEFVIERAKIEVV